MADRVINAGTWGGAVIAGLGAWTIQEWLALAGFLLALVSLIFNIIHKTRIYRLEKKKAGL